MLPMIIADKYLGFPPHDRCPLNVLLPHACSMGQVIGHHLKKKKRAISQHLGLRTKCGFYCRKVLNCEYLVIAN